MRSGEIMVVLIVLIFAVSRIVQAKYGVAPRGRRGRRGEEDYALPQRDDGEADRLRGEVRQLKDRIQVLERIVTDSDRNRGLALEQEIEQLRDQRRANRDREVQ